MKTIFNPPGTWSPSGRGFSMGVVQPAGRVVHFTGQVAWDADENIVGPGDVGEQTRQCLRNIEAVLAAVGGTLEDIVSVTTYYTARDQLPAIQKVRTEFFPAGTAPASTSVMTAGLGHPDFLVELAPVAVIPEYRYRDPGVSAGMKPGWIEDQNGCLLWNSAPAPGDSVTWSGSCRDGKASGPGTAEWRRDGELRGTYVGELREGWAEGQGVFTGPDGGTYEGQWQDGLRHGKGAWTSAEGTTYEGLYEAGRAHGEGTNTWADGSRFTGEFLEGRRWNGTHYDAAQDQELEIRLGRWKLTGRPAD